MRRRSPAPFVLVAACVGLLLATTHVSTQTRTATIETEDVGGREAVAREVLVKFRSGIPKGTVSAVGAELQADAIVPMGRTRLMRVRSRVLDAAGLIERLRSRPDVEYAEPNFVFRALTQPNDPSFPQLWGLLNVGQAVNGAGAGVAGADIGATEAWNTSTGTTSNVVAIVDTGVDYTHPDLAANIWSAPEAFTVTVGGRAIACPAGSHGFNAIAFTCDPMDDHNHGTHVAGTIGASGGNGTGVVGVNWVTRIMALKFLDASGTGTTSGAIDALEFAIRTKVAFAASGGANIRVVSNSWGGGAFSQALLDEILAANDHDMLFVAAAGNSHRNNDVVPTFPGSYKAANVIAVAATTNGDERASFSNYGAKTVHLGAPGVDVLSTTIGNTYRFFSGTSMATPHVSGAAALMLAACPLDTRGLKEALLGTVQPVPALTTTVTGGRLDVARAVSTCSIVPDVPGHPSAKAGDGRVTLTWTAAAYATRYIVKRAPAPGGPYDRLEEHATGTAYLDGSAVNGTTYYYVVSAANAAGESADSSEASATPSLPSDLTISALTLPAIGGAGQRIAGSETTTNRGQGRSAPSTTRFYLSDNLLFDASDVELNLTHQVPALDPGQSDTASLSLLIPEGTATGQRYVIARADADDVLEEQQEQNNSRSRGVQVGPDLVVTTLGIPGSGASGAPIVVTDTVRNQGGGGAPASAVRYYLSSDNRLDASDVPMPAGRAVPALTAGGSNAGTVTLTVPASTPVGAYYVVAVADGNAAIDETQEGNNTSTRPIQIGVDLTVSSLSVPLKAGLGSTVTIGATTTNRGGGVSGAAMTRFYLSTDSDLDETDVEVGHGLVVPPLPAGGVSAGTIAVVIPSETGAGTRYIIARADADDTEVETQEQDNTTARSIAVGPDLRLSVLSLPSTVLAGSLLTINDTVINVGEGTTGASTTRFYLSSNTVLDAGDVPLSGARAVQSLGSGASNGGSTTVTVPGDVAPGSYYLIAKADADDAVTESQEGNNMASRALLVTASR